jgi:hypothetical protein
MATDYMRGKLAETKNEPLFLRGTVLDAHLAERDGEFQDVALVRYQGLPDPVWPVLALVVVLGTAIGIRSLRAGGSARTGDSPPTYWRHAALSGAVLAAYVLSMQAFGIPYAVATSVFIPALAIVAGARTAPSVAKVTALGIAMACACFFIFTKVLVIDLP